MEIETLATKHVEGELDRQAREMQVDHERRMLAIKEDAEGELRAQLRRQAAAHTDHLTDVLSVQEAELTRHHEHQMTEEMARLTSTQVASMASLSGTVTGLTEAIQARASSDSASLTSQSLWLACNTLNTTLTRGRVDATTWEEKLNPLVKEVGQVKVVAGDDDKFVEVVLASISPMALERGVYTEDSLKERFTVVEKTARKVAGIGEEGGSLLAYGLSYLQSLLMVDLVQRNPAENVGVVDLFEVSPMDLVSMAKHSLDQGDLARAVQLMTQLKGESGRVVSDWVAEARLTLETKQAVQAIMVHSLANSCKYMPGV
jgi:mitofilin